MAVVQVAQWLHNPSPLQPSNTFTSKVISTEQESHVDDEYVRDIPKRHPRIFRRNKRQSGGDLGWMASAASNAFKLYSLMSSVMGGPKPKDPNRIDTDVKEEITVTTENKEEDGLDEALGTLMAYGGQYLRKMALWGWEMATATPSEKIGDAPIDPIPSTSTSTSALSSSLSSLASVSVSNPLKRLSSAELEKLGLKAVQSGADPTQLQQAFATAQLDGNWKPLEKLIVKALGSQAVYGNNKPSTTNFGTTSTVAVPASGAGGGLSYVKLKAQEVMQKLNRVVNGYPQGTKPAYPGVQDTMLLRFVKEFQLEKEALAMQESLNSAIFAFNNMLGTKPSASDKIDTPDTNSNSPGILSSILSLPQKLIGLLTGASAKPDKPIKKVDASGATYSEVQAVSPVGSLAVGAVGTTVVAGALYYLYNSYLEDEKRRRSDLGTLNRRNDQINNNEFVENNKFYDYDNNEFEQNNQYNYAENDAEDEFYDNSWDSQDQQNAYFEGQNDYYTNEEGYGGNNDYYENNGYNNLNTNDNYENLGNGDNYDPYYSGQVEETNENEFYRNNENEFYGNNANYGNIERSGNLDKDTSLPAAPDVVDQHGGGSRRRRRRRSPW